MTYELWETAAGNLVGAYATREHALDVVERCINAYGKEYVATWLLAFEDDRGNGDTLAEGHELVDLVLHRAIRAASRGVTA